MDSLPLSHQGSPSLKYPYAKLRTIYQKEFLITFQCLYILRTNWADCQLIIQRKWLMCLDTRGKVDRNDSNLGAIHQLGLIDSFQYILSAPKAKLLHTTYIVFILKYGDLQLLFKGKLLTWWWKDTWAKHAQRAKAEMPQNAIKNRIPSWFFYLSFVLSLFDFATSVAYHVLSAMKNNSVNLCSIYKGGFKPTRAKAFSPSLLF